MKYRTGSIHCNLSRTLHEYSYFFRSTVKDTFCIMWDRNLQIQPPLSITVTIETINLRCTQSFQVEIVVSAENHCGLQ